MSESRSARYQAPSPANAERAAAVADRLHSAAIHLLRRVRAADDATGLGPAALSALSVIVFRGPVTLGELAVAEHVRPPTITQLVAGLERAGLVAREAGMDDRRIRRVRATAKGRQLLSRGRERRVSALAARLVALPAADLALLDRAAGIIEDALKGER